jgi:selenide,water dikinase
LTKKIGVGILTTAEKKNQLTESDKLLAAEQMMELNKVGSKLGAVAGVHAMTDITGFGLLGHLIEMAEGSGLSATIEFNQVPLISKRLIEYVEMGAVPGGTNRNWDSYGHRVKLENNNFELLYKNILADPQTSGGLLISVGRDSLEEVISILNEYGLSDRTTPIGEMHESESFAVRIN